MLLQVCACAEAEEVDRQVFAYLVHAMIRCTYYNIEVPPVKIKLRYHILQLLENIHNEMKE